MRTDSYSGPAVSGPAFSDAAFSAPNSDVWLLCVAAWPNGRFSCCRLCRILCLAESYSQPLWWSCAGFSDRIGCFSTVFGQSSLNMVIMSEKKPCRMSPAGRRGNDIRRLITACAAASSLHASVRPMLRIRWLTAWECSAVPSILRHATYREKNTALLDSTVVTAAQ